MHKQTNMRGYEEILYRMAEGEYLFAHSNKNEELKIRETIHSWNRVSDTQVIKHIEKYILS